MADEKSVSDWLENLARLADDREREEFFKHHPHLRTRSTLDDLNQELLMILRQDRAKAERLALTICWLGDSLEDNYSRGVGAKALANIRYLEGSYETALTHYLEAARRFRDQGAAIDAAVTLSSSIHTQILLGRYVQAFAAAREARQVFEQHDESLLLARLNSNEAQIFLRQGHLESALQRFERALEIFRLQGGPQDLAAALYNIAVCRIGLHHFPQALAAYKELSSHCAEHAMQAVAAQADYNIAYLYFLRGEYIHALELYRRTRELLEAVGDPYHRSLCDLDQAEIHLELNLTDDGDRLAERAAHAFEELGNSFEAAKAIAFRAIAASQKGKIDETLELFDRAHERFEREDNLIWLAVIEFYKALVLHRADRSHEARQLAKHAMALFLRFQQVGKVVLCQLLLARIDLTQGNPGESRLRCRSALSRLDKIDVPVSRFQAHFILGQAAEALDDRQGAICSYRDAHRMLEDLRCHLRGEDLKIAFLKDKYEIYESLVALTLEHQPTLEDKEQAFLYIEQAKSRSLADLVAFSADALPATANGDPDLVARLNHQRDELNWTYRQIDLYELGKAEDDSPTNSSGKNPQVQPDDDDQPGTALRLGELRKRCSEHERRLLQTLAELRSKDVELSSLQAAGSLEIESLQAALPDKTLLLEFFESRGRLFVGLLRPDSLNVLPLGSTTRVKELGYFLQFNFSKFQLTPDYIQVFGKAIYRTTLAYLGELYDLLMAPLEEHLDADRLIIVPHGTLHYIPFHALWDGDGFLIDRFPISYAPSASVLAMCCAKPASHGRSVVIMGVPDALTPQIHDEVEAVAATLPNAQLFVGEAATEERLRALGPQSRLIHLATHGVFRMDNPMFSAIQLGTTRLTLFDLYQLELAADLVVLSGCATGYNVLDTGDELIGLTRGLLYAGARAALVTLWDVNDASTAKWMIALYRHLESGFDRAAAIRQAMLELRETHPHPFHWAPFVLIGKPCEA